MAALALVAVMFYLSNHFQQRSMSILEGENSLLQRQIGKGEVRIQQRLHSLGLAWDNYSLELAADALLYADIADPVALTRAEVEGRL